jgi:hypothetical protein
MRQKKKRGIILENIAAYSWRDLMEKSIIGRIIASLFWLSMFLFVLSLIGWHLIDELTFVQHAPTAIVKGTITQVTTKEILTPSNHYETCDALITFSPYQKHSIEFSSDISCDSKVGDIVSVAYHIADPNDARVIPPGGFLLRGWVLFVVIIVFLLVGGAIARTIWRD